VSDVRPFRALRYDPRRVELSRVLAPVYDVVAPEERATYYARDPHNAIRLELTKRVEDEAATDYAEAARTLAAWRREGVLALDAEPALYVLRQRFAGPGGAPLERTGFFAALRLEDYAARVVRPHERTLAAPKADRLKLLRATRANLSAVFLLYEDRAAKLAPLLEGALSGPGTVTVEDDAGVAYALAPLRDAAAARAVTEFLAERPLVIADGHHRYETALSYRDERRAAAGRVDAEAPEERLLVYLANAFAPGSLLLPIHRLLLAGAPPDEATWQRLEACGFSRREVEVADAEALPAALEAQLAPLAPEAHAFAADDGSGRLRIFSRPAGEELSVRVIHREVLAGVFGLGDEAVRQGAVAFPKSALQTARELRQGRGRVALYLNPLTPDDVFRVTEAGETLPQKSTFFQPKLPTGLLFRVLEPGA
jgi:uncharacterized protein (DUF1015 family)